MGLGKARTNEKGKTEWEKRTKSLMRTRRNILIN